MITYIPISDVSELAIDYFDLHVSGSAMDRRNITMSTEENNAMMEKENAIASTFVVFGDGEGNHLESMSDGLTDQERMLANINLASEIADENLRLLSRIQAQQMMFLSSFATLGRGISVMLTTDLSGSASSENIAAHREIMDELGEQLARMQDIIEPMS